MKEPEPASEPETATDPETAPSKVYAELPEARTSKRGRYLVSGLVLALGGGLVWSETGNSAEAIVADFFEAIVDKDVDRALSHVAREGYGVPSGEDAVFLAPDAIAGGWELLEAELSPVEGEYGAERVEVVIGSGKSKQTGYIEVSQSSDEWRIVDPFVVVEVSATSLTYMRVNDKTVVSDELYAHDATGLLSREYKLLPGMNRLFGDLKGTTTESKPGELMLPAENEYDDPPVVGPPELTFTDAVQESVQESVNGIVDECAEFKVRQPALCPFGIDYYYYPDDETGYEDIHDVTWTVEKQPRVHLEDPGDGDERELGIPVTVDDPGVIALKATASKDGRDDPVTLTAECGLSEEPLRVALQPDGEPQVYPLAQAGTGILNMPFDLDTCGNKMRDDDE